MRSGQIANQGSSNRARANKSLITTSSFLSISSLIYFYRIDQMPTRFCNLHYGITVIVSFVTAISLGIVATRSILSRYLPRGSVLAEIAILSFTSIMLFLCVDTFGMRQFNGFDVSITIEFGKRMLEGFKPYTDFPCTVPPLYFLPIPHAFSQLGTEWRTIVRMGGWFGVMTFLWHYMMLRSARFSHFQSYLASAAIQCFTTIILSYWWHNSVSVLAGLSLVLAAQLLLERPMSRFGISSLAIATVMAVYGKANSWPLIPGVYFILFSKRSCLRGVAISAILSAGGVFAVSRVYGFALGDFLDSTVSVASSRGIPNPISRLIGMGFARSQVLYFLMSMAFFGFVLIRRVCSDAIAAIPSDAKLCRFRSDAMFLGCALVGILLLGTNIENKEVDLAYLFLAAYLLEARRIRDQVAQSPMAEPVIPGAFRMALDRKFGRDRFSTSSISVYGLVTCVLIAMSVNSLTYGSGRGRVMIAGPFFEFQLSKIGNEYPFFESFRSGPAFRQILDDIADIVRDHPGKSIFFGPRLEFAYATFGLASPSNLPVWWHKGTSYSNASEANVAKKWIDHSFDVLVLFDENSYVRSSGQIFYGKGGIGHSLRSKNIYNYFFPQEIIDQIDEKYELNFKNYRNLIVGYRKR